MTKYIFITGGVVSSLGKGIIAASLGKLLRARGFSVINQKFDPYINVDPGTMSPFQHGEVFVTDDGAETDLDLGHYERFTDTNLGKLNNVTSGSVYQRVIDKERRGDYLGGTVQVIPHITNEIKARIVGATKQFKPDFQLIEIGGTIGDIESLPFIEAIRQFRAEEGYDKTLSIHVTLLPYLQTSGELKTKPSQHSVNTLRGFGIQPEILICRTQQAIPKEEKDKLALFCSVPKDCVIECQDMSTIYEVPIALEEQGMASVILKKLGMADKKPNLDSWKKIIEVAKNPTYELNVAIVGECSQVNDAYLSIVESLKHAGFAQSSKIKIKWVESEANKEEDKIKEILKDVDAVVVPGVYGARGIEGKLNIIKYVRENNIPYLGVSLGFQCAVVEYARNVAGMTDANSTEFVPTANCPVISIMEDEKSTAGYHSSVRLGACDTLLKASTKTRSAYGEKQISERHRHRYEFNNYYRQNLEEKGLVVSGTSSDGFLVDIIEVPENDWHVACQFHPEFKSRPERPHPLFNGLIKATIKQKTKKK